MKKVLIALSLSAILWAQSSEVIAMRAYEKVSNYRSSISQTTMVLKNAQGDENVRKIEMKKLEQENGDRSLLTFLYPNDLKGTKLLSYEVIGGDDKQWLYLPAIKRIKRISSRNKSGAFMASEFSYEDISSQNYKNYNYPNDVEVIKIENVDYFKVVRIPKDKHSGYSKQIIYIDTKEYLARFGNYFDKNGKLLKEIFFEDYVNIDGVWRVHKIVVKNVQTKKSSILVWDSDKVDAGLSKQDFVKRVLR